MRIVKLEAENVKRLRAVEIEPSGHMVVIGGKNAQGKSSLLDSIMYAMAGGRALPDEPLRRGADHGHVEVTLSDGLVVRRTFTPSGGGTLTVRSKDGGKYGQAKLDSILGRISFDPLAFAQAKSDAQADMLLALVGRKAELAGLDAERSVVFESRTQVGRDLKAAEARLKPQTGNEPTQPVDVHAVLEAQREAMATIARNEQSRHNVQRYVDAAYLAQSALKDAKARAEQFRESLRKAEADAADLERVLREANETTETARAAVASLVDPDVSVFGKQLQEAEAVNAAWREAQSQAAERESVAKLTATRDGLTAKIGDIDAKSAAILAAAELPVAGLGIGPGGVTYNGIPFSQASEAERINVSAALGLSANPTLKVLLVRNGSLLDTEHLAMLGEIAEKAGGQVWVEDARASGPGVIEIEDGTVKEKEGPNG